MDVISDERIQEYISEKKIIPKSFNPILKDKNCGHLQFHGSIIGENGNSFYVGIRENKLNPTDFSVIFGVKINGKIFKLKRYNGDHGEHTNKLNNEKINGFHIHKATKIYQENGFEEEGYAEKTTRYNEWRTALKVLYKDNNFQLEIEKKSEKDIRIWKVKQY